MCQRLFGSLTRTSQVQFPFSCFPCPTVGSMHVIPHRKQRNAKHSNMPKTTDKYHIQFMKHRLSRPRLTTLSKNLPKQFLANIRGLLNQRLN